MNSRRINIVKSGEKFIGKLPPGSYFIGSMSGALSHHWMEFCDLSSTDDGEIFDGHFSLASGIEFMVFTVDSPLDRYIDKDGYVYPSEGEDQGEIGIVQIAGLNPEYRPYGRVVEFAEEFTVKAEDGIINFGDIIINTRDK